MKRILFISLVVVFTMAANKSIPHEVRSILGKALAGEREAIARYDAYAAKAVEEGYLGAAALFRAEAKAERTHARRFESVMTANGMDVPAESAVQPAVGSTERNLRDAAAAEAAERDGIYRDAVEAARTSAPEIAKMFDQTRDTEVEHANLCVAAVRDMDKLKAAKTFYVCDRCGYTTDIALGRCPACMHSDMESVR